MKEENPAFVPAMGLSPRRRDKVREQVIRVRRRGGTPIPRMSAWREAPRYTFADTENAMEIASRGTLAHESGQLCAQA